MKKTNEPSQTITQKQFKTCQKAVAASMMDIPAAQTSHNMGFLKNPCSSVGSIAIPNP
jgi:hypothetical protein